MYTLDNGPINNEQKDNLSTHDVIDILKIGTSEIVNDDS